MNPDSGSVTLEPLFNVSEPQFPLLKVSNDSNPYLARLEKRGVHDQAHSTDQVHPPHHRRHHSQRHRSQFPFFSQNIAWCFRMSKQNPTCPVQSPSHP